MGDAPFADVEGLLRALAKERSLRGRLRVLGRSWKMLRSLPPVDRERVALRLGSKWAWKRVEKAFLKDGELSENEQLVGRAFERMGGADPTELRKLARTIREGDSESARDLLMLTLTEALEEEADEEEARPTPAPPPRAAEAQEPEEPEPLVDADSLVRETGVQDSDVPEARLVERVEDVAREGDMLTVKVIDVDRDGKVRLSRKAVIMEEAGEEYTPSPRKPSGGGPRRGGRRPAGAGRR